MIGKYLSYLITILSSIFTHTHTHTYTHMHARTHTHIYLPGNHLHLPYLINHQNKIGMCGCYYNVHGSAWTCFAYRNQFCLYGAKGVFVGYGCINTCVTQWFPNIQHCHLLKYSLLWCIFHTQTISKQYQFVLGE